MASDRRTPRVLIGLTFTLWLGVAIMLLVVTPRMEAVFTDFGVALPILAVAAIDASRWLRGAGGGVPGAVVAGPVYLLMLIAPVAWAALAPRSKAPRAALLVLALVCAAGLLFLAIAIGAPYLRLLEAIAEQP